MVALLAYFKFNFCIAYVHLIEISLLSFSLQHLYKFNTNSKIFVTCWAQKNQMD